MNGYVLTVERRVDAPPGPIFEFLCDASNHALIDGSGMLQGLPPADGGDVKPEPLVLGSTFGMGMKMGLRYTTRNRVVEFEPNRLIAWQTGPDGTWGRLVAGRIWRYELEPVGDGTRVRESWDISEEKIKAIVRPARKKTRAAMEKTLARIEELLTT